MTHVKVVTKPPGHRGTGSMTNGANPVPQILGQNGSAAGQFPRRCESVANPVCGCIRVGGAGLGLKTALVRCRTSATSTSRMPAPQATSSEIASSQLLAEVQLIIINSDQKGITSRWCASTMKRELLLIGHLENVSGRVMEAYPKIIRAMIRGRHGIYALYKLGRLYYVGLATNLMHRINSHLRDRHRGKWDRFSVYLTTRSEHIKELESLLLRIISPDGNRASGRLKGSENLLLALHRLLREDDADRRASILGGHIAERRQRIKARRGKGNEALAGFTDRTIRLRGNYHGKMHLARLRPNGSIKLGQKLFDSPSAAAKRVVGRNVNGWAFWHYRASNGEWRTLKTIKQ
jgi:hypothetical protein